jgi:hypothetical protein
VPSKDQGVLDEPKDLDYLPKFLLRVVADCFGGDDENDQSVGNPKRKV